MDKLKNRKIILISLFFFIVFFIGFNFLLTNEKEEIVMKKELNLVDNPQKAFQETQKALALLSLHLNIGMKSVVYVQEYENAKNKIFKKP